MSLQESPAALRRRLMNPPNAVKDDGIDLRRHLRPVPVLVAAPVVPIVELPKKAPDRRTIQRRFDRACLSFFIWQCTPVEKLRRVASRNRRPPAHVTMPYILRIVADHFGVTVDGLKSERRFRHLAHPRQIAYWLCRRLTNNSLPQIAKFMRKKDHTSVWHGINRIENERHMDLQLAKTMEELLSQLSLPPVNKADKLTEHEETSLSNEQISSGTELSVASALSSTLENRNADDQSSVSA